MDLNPYFDQHTHALKKYICTVYIYIYICAIFFLRVCVQCCLAVQETDPSEGIIEIWEKFLQAKASHDLRILAADDCVTAHAQMLREASPVVHAMLGAAMKEQKTQEIQLQDTSGSAVNLFLETLYTCSSQGDPDYNTALSALDLAHRWQVDVVVVILQDLLSELISEDSFLTIAEHAQLKGLENLKRSCQSFGAQSPTILEKAVLASKKN